MSTQTPLERTFYIYECPVGCHRYWDPNPHLGPDTDHGHDVHLFCERCGRACHRIGSFAVSPFDPDSLPNSEDLPLESATDDVTSERRVAV